MIWKSSRASLLFHWAAGEVRNAPLPAPLWTPQYQSSSESAVVSLTIDNQYVVLAASVTGAISTEYEYRSYPKRSTPMLVRVTALPTPNPNPYCAPQKSGAPPSSR